MMNHRDGTYAIVLLSGGMDSVGAVHWALPRYKEVVALGFDYGQPSRDAEIPAAGRIARELGIRYEVRAIADAMRVTRPSGLLAGAPEDTGKIDGVHPAFVPGRNVIFLALAAAEGASIWPAGYFDIVIGANLDDAAGFPDCRRGFFDEYSVVLRKAYARELRVVAPWASMSKADIVAYFKCRENTAADATALRDIQRSWSCYSTGRSGGGGCARCTPCLLRAAAFEMYGVVDLATAPTLVGGDPGRSK